MMTETEEEVAKTETDEQREIEKEEKIMTGRGGGMKTGEGRMKRTEGGLGGTGSEMTKTEGRRNMMGGGETMRGRNEGGRKASTGVMAIAREDGKTMNMGSGVVVIIEIETGKEEEDRTGTEMAEAQVADMIEMGGKERKGMSETGRETTRGKGPVKTITVAGREKSQLSEAWIG